MLVLTRKLILLLLLPLLFSCSTNYYYAIVNEDTPLYASKDDTGVTAVLITKGEPVFLTRGTKKYRKVKYAHYSGWVANPSYTLASNPNTSSSYNSRSSGSSSSSSSSSKTVHVKGYTRKDGTYVRPHTRSAPRRH